MINENQNKNHNENPIKICWYCKKEFDGDFEIKDFSIICPHCKRPQLPVFEEENIIEEDFEPVEEDFKSEIIKKDKAATEITII